MDRSRSHGFAFWCRWLLATSVLIMSFGAVLVVFGGTSLFDVFSAPFWGSVPPTPAERSYQAWSNGVLGATMTGWGVFFLFMARHPFAGRERWAWQAVFVGVITWFAMDTAISVAYGADANVLLNGAFLVLVLIPLLATRSAFSAHPDVR